MKKVLIFFLILVCGFLFFSCNKQKGKAGKIRTGQEKVKIAFVYVGPVGDAGWTLAHDNARKELEKELPFVETSFIESVAEGSDADRVFTEFAKKGYNVIIGTSFGYMDSMVRVSRLFPDCIFLHCAGYKTTPNLGTYFGRMYQVRYLSGMIAGKMTKSNILGYVAAHPIPEVIRGINAFTLGARKVNPNVKVHVVWTHTWYDPATEREAAEGLLDIGADVITQHQDTPAPQQAAEARGKWSIGYNSDMSQFAPTSHLVACVWNWTPYYVEIAKEVKEGKWRSEDYWKGIETGIVGLSNYNPKIPREVIQLIEKEKEKIISGKNKIFTGPIKDNNGNLKVRAGETMTNEQLRQFDWFVEGVVGKI